MTSLDSGGQASSFNTVDLGADQSLAVNLQTKITKYFEGKLGTFLFFEAASSIYFFNDHDGTNITYNSWFGSGLAEATL